MLTDSVTILTDSITLSETNEYIQTIFVKKDQTS
jgi:hypothetical protein